MGFFLDDLIIHFYVLQSMLHNISKGISSWINPFKFGIILRLFNSSHLCVTGFMFFNTYEDT
jgi:hypothetical protein